jgi:hypothetical protein
VSRSKKARKPGRPKLPRGKVKGRIVPVRFSSSDLKAITAAAKDGKQTISDLIRNIVGGNVDEWTVIDNGKRIRFTYKEIGPHSAEMTARVEGDKFTQLLRKTGLTLPLRRKDVVNMFVRVFSKD